MFTRIDRTLSQIVYLNFKSCKRISLEFAFLINRILI